MTKVNIVEPEKSELSLKDLEKGQWVRVVYPEVRVGAVGVAATSSSFSKNCDAVVLINGTYVTNTDWRFSPLKEVTIRVT